MTFGFSAFLRVLSLNDKPQKTAIKERLGPSSGSGYDFHKRFRQLARRYLVEEVSLADVIASAHTIVQSPERISAIAALEQLALWKAGTPGELMYFAPVTFESPRQLFKVKFEPDFGIRINGKATAIHLWNTKAVQLAPGPTYAALALVAQAFQSQDNGPDDVAVLSLRDPLTAYLLSEVSDGSAIAASMVEHIESIIQGPMSPPSPPEDRPFA